MLLPSGNPIKCHEEVFVFAAYVPAKRFDISSLAGGCSEGLDAFRFFFKKVLKQVQTAVQKYANNSVTVRRGVCYIQCAGYTSVYTVYRIVFSSVESNDTTSAVSPTRRGPHEKTYGMWDRRRNIDASLEVWMLWLGCLSTTPSTVPAGCQLGDTRAAPHPLDLRGVILKPPKPHILLNFEHHKHLGPCRQRPLFSLE